MNVEAEPGRQEIPSVGLSNEGVRRDAKGGEDGRKDDSCGPGQRQRLICIHSVLLFAQHSLGIIEGEKEVEINGTIIKN